MPICFVTCNLKHPVWGKTEK